MKLADVPPFTEDELQSIKNAVIALKKRGLSVKIGGQSLTTSLLEISQDLTHFIAASTHSPINDIKVLQILERQPLTIQNLANSFNTSLEDVYPLVRNLFDEGLIDRVDGSVLQKLFPVLRAKRRRQTDISSLHFTLTAKGHFTLNPIITIGYR